MKIGLIGYGKMGKAIEAIALERGHTIAFTVNSQLTIDQVQLSSADVAIEFSQPNLVIEHIKKCLREQLPIVVGTTAWQKQLPEIEKLTNQLNGSLLHASNFSVGVNLFFQLNERLASLMSNHTNYSASIEEIHHIQKLDAPSGTAVTLADGIIKNHTNYLSWVCGEEFIPETNDQQIAITAIREPDVPGTHTIHYQSTIDTLSITHQAHNRLGFAQGAVLAAEFLYGKKGIFTMRDVLKKTLDS